VHTRDWLEVGASLLPLLILAPPLGFTMYRVWEQPQRLPRPVQAVERLFFRLIGADPAHEMEGNNGLTWAMAAPIKKILACFVQCGL